MLSNWLQSGSREGDGQASNISLPCSMLEVTVIVRELYCLVSDSGLSIGLPGGQGTSRGMPRNLMVRSLPHLNLSVHVKPGLNRI